MNIVVIAHNIRSTYNVGSILRTSDGFGVSKVIMTGYTPYPTQTSDTRLPHLQEKITRQIHKTALGAETTVPTEYYEDPLPILSHLRDKGYQLLALEQSPRSVMLPNLTPPRNVALLLGEEVNGITQNLLALCDVVAEIPMKGAKESFNVSVAAAIALYELSKHAD